MARNEESKGPKDESAQNEKGVLSRILAAVTGQSGNGIDSTATTMLRGQHDEVRELFKQYEDASDGAVATKKRLIDTVSRELEIHAQLEEQIFYPACKVLHDEKARKMVGESLEEHLIVKRLIKELAGITGSDDTFSAKATVLREVVEHHADEEESDLFPAAEKELGEDRLTDLAHRMSELKTRMSGGTSRSRIKSTAARAALRPKRSSH